MTEHEHVLALAAASVDFPLSPEDAGTLEAHLVTCPACASAARRLWSDATALASMDRRPAPAHVRQALARAATPGRRQTPRGVGMRWSFAAALLALVAVGGTFVAGAVLERTRETGPTATDDLAPRPTLKPAPSRTTGFVDLALVDAFEGATIQLVVPGPDGGLVAIGRAQGSSLPAVWTSGDGLDWTATDQPDDVFGGRVPTGAAVRDGVLWAVGWDINVGAPQRAVWSSTDGVTWRRAGGTDGLLGTEASDLEVAAGPAGVLVWASDGRVWTSPDGQRWTRADAGITGATDAAVDAAGFHLVGLGDARASLVGSVDGRSWGTPARQTAGVDARVGIERSDDDTLLAWIGDEAYDVTTQGWRRAASAPAVPSGTLVGGTGFAVVSPPTAAGVQRASIGDGAQAWRALRSDPVATGGRTLVAVAPDGDGWYVLTRQGTTYRGWLLS